MRAKPLLALLLLAVLGIGGAWFLSTRDSLDGPSGPALSGGLNPDEGLLPDSGAAGGTGDASMASPEAPDPDREDRDRSDLTGSLAADEGAGEIDGDAASWLEVQVLAPGSPPADDSLRVLALVAGADAEGALDTLAVDLHSHRGWKEQKKRIARQDAVAWTRQPVRGGTARIPLPEGATRASLLLDGRYLFLAAPWSVDLATERGPVQLDAEAGAFVHLRYTLPPGAEARGVTDGGDALEEGGLRVEGSRMFRRGRGGRPAFYELALADGPSFDLRGVQPGVMMHVFGRLRGLAPLSEMGLRFEPYEEREVEVAFQLGGEVSGRVLDLAGQPIPGAEVALATGMWSFLSGGGNMDTTSDGDGRYHLVGVPAGTMQLEAQATGWLGTSSEEFEVADGDRIQDFDLRLERGASLAGRVVFEDGRPAPGAQVRARARATGRGRGPFANGRNLGEVAEATSDEEGRFVVLGLTEGEVRVSASLGRVPDSGSWNPMGLDLDDVADVNGGTEEPEPSTGWQSPTTDAETGAEDVELVLEERVALTGFVKDDLGEAITDFTLTASRAEQASTPWVREGRVQEAFSERADGSFEFWGLVAGDWSLEVRAEGYAEHEGSQVDVQVPMDGSPLQLVLARAATVSGIVVDPNGQPVRAQVIASGEGGRGPWSRQSGRVSSGRDGRFVLEGLPVGSLELHAESDDWASSPDLPVECVSGEGVEGLVLALREGGRITGEVYDAQGEPSPGRRVSYSANAMGGGAFGGGPSTTTDGAGRFTLEHVTPGTWSVTAGMNEKDQIELMTSAKDPSAFMEIFTQNDTAQVEVVDGETVHVVLGGDPIVPVRILGRVRQDGDAVADTQVFAVAEDGALFKGMKMATTEADGGFEMSVDRPGAYVFTVQGAGRGTPVRFPADIPEVEEYALDLDLPSGGIEGTVTTAEGEAAAGVAVRLSSDDEPQFFDGPGGARTDDEGHYSFSGLRAGTYTVRAGSAGGPFGGPGGRYGTSILSGIDVDEDAVTRGADLALAEACTLEGVVRDGEGRGVDGASVFVRDAQGRLLSRVSSTVTNAAGRFEYEGVSPGMVTVSARTKDRVSPSSSPVRVDVGESAEVQLTLETGTTLVIEVVDGEGEPLRATVRVYDEADYEVGNMMTLESMQEMFTEGFSTRETKIGPLPSGKYRVEAVDGEGRQARKPVTLKGQETRKVKLRLKD